MSNSLDEYKKKVYKVAREVQKNQDWCESGFWEAMKQLDIDAAFIEGPDNHKPGTIFATENMTCTIIAVKDTSGKWRGYNWFHGELENKIYNHIADFKSDYSDHKWRKLNIGFSWAM